MRALVPAAALAAALALTACGGAGAAAPSPPPSPAPTFTALSLAGACKALRADILANGGTPDAATLQRVIGHSTDGDLIHHAQMALDDIGKSGIAMGIILGAIGHDCRTTGVQIPQG